MNNTPFDKMKVLAVDDNRTNLHIIQVFLKKLGHEVILAADGEEAVQRFISEAPDLVLLDIMMPIMDGFEAARRIKALSQDRWTPIIFLSALNRDENLVEGLEAGADDYLTKPINFVVLEAKLRSMQRSLAMQQAAVTALDRLQAISDNVNDAIISTDENGRVETMNRAAESIFGWPAADIGGEPLGTLIPALLSDDGLRTYLQGTQPQLVDNTREVVAVHKSGRQFPAALSISETAIDGATSFVCVVRDISERKLAEEKLRDNARQLQAFYDQTQSEQQLALQLMERQLHRQGLRDNRLRYRVLPSEGFSGDIVGATRCADGRFYALLADATGHGLPAAISALPLLALFYRMTRMNRPLREIILELNQQLREAMPVGRFIATTLVCLDEHQRTGEIWVGGTPPALLFDRWGRVDRTFPSENLPLGIVGNESLDVEPVVFDWQSESQVLMCSDGLIEATNPDNVQFGLQGLIQSAQNTSPDVRFERIESALLAHLANRPAGDDVSLMLIDCV